MTDDVGHDWAGAYVLGALSSDDRIAFELHLETCDQCTRDVLELSALPGLLAGVEEADLDGPPTAVRDRVIAAAAGGTESRRLARSRRRWRLGAALAAIAAAVLAAVLVFQDDPVATDVEIAGTFVELDVGSDYAELTGTISLSQRPWGTLILVDLFDAPKRSQYTMWTVSDSGEWDEITTWLWSDLGTCRVPGASTLTLDAIDRVVVTAADDRGDSIAWST